MTGALVLVVALAAATVFGLVHRARQGRFRASGAAGTDAARTGAARTDAARIDSRGAALHDVLAALGATPGERATLLQFSSAFCAPCRATRRVLADVAQAVPGVAHVEVDAEQHLDVVRRLRIASTPTTLVLDADARVAARATGQPRRDAVLAALADAVA